MRYFLARFFGYLAVLSILVAFLGNSLLAILFGVEADNIMLVASFAAVYFGLFYGLLDGILEKEYGFAFLFLAIFVFFLWLDEIQYAFAIIVVISFIVWVIPLIRKQLKKQRNVNQKNKAIGICQHRFRVL